MTCIVAKFDREATGYKSQTPSKSIVKPPST